MRGLVAVAVSSGLVVAAAIDAFAQQAAKADVLTYHGDAARTGQNVAETVLTPAAVAGPSFRRVATVFVDGYVYAQPLVVTGVAVPRRGTLDLLLVATEHDSVYAFDVTGRAPRFVWRRHLAPRGERPVLSVREAQCEDLVPEIGITSTPVVDRATMTVYVLAKTAALHGVFHQRLHALDVATGAEKLGGPVEIAASVAGSGDGSAGGTITFDPLRQHQRSGLLLAGGAVFIAWASHCDNGPYHGWVMAFDAATLAPRGVFVTTPDGGLGGIWQAGGGLAADAQGGIYAATGNGTFDADRGGRDYGDSAIRLSLGAGLSLTDYFTPFNQAALESADADLGSGAVLVLPDQAGTHPHEIVFAGKEGKIYVVDRDAMGRFHAGDDSQIVQSIPSAVGGSFGTPAYWNGHVYWHGAGDSLKSFTVTNGSLSTSPESDSGVFFGFPGATPTVSSNGTADGVVWEIETDAYHTKGPAVLRAFDATDLTHQLYRSDAAGARDVPGAAVKFAAPTVANGKVFVGAVRRVAVYGLR